MRNREQIYGQEAAGLLRNITVYHCIRYAMTSSCACIRARRASLRICCAIWSSSSGYFITLTGIATEMSLTAARTEN